MQHKASSARPRRPSTSHPPPIACQRGHAAPSQGWRVQDSRTGAPCSPTPEPGLAPDIPTEAGFALVHRWTMGCPSCAHHPGHLPKALLPVKALPSNTHQA